MSTFLASMGASCDSQSRIDETKKKRQYKKRDPKPSIEIIKYEKKPEQPVIEIRPVQIEQVPVKRERKTPMPCCYDFEISGKTYIKVNEPESKHYGQVRCCNCDHFIRHAIDPEKLLVISERAYKIDRLLELKEDDKRITDAMVQFLISIRNKKTVNISNGKYLDSLVYTFLKSPCNE